MKNVLLLGLSLFLIFMSMTAAAVKVNDLYTGEIEVSTQSNEEKQKAIQAALAKVFVKISGTEQILANSRIKQHLRNPSSLTQQVGYNISANKIHPYVLQVRFDPNAINQCLRDANAPIWEQNRPLIFGWIVDETVQPAKIIHPNDNTSMGQSLKQAMEKRGVPFVLPAVDVETLALASTQYKSDALLTGQIQKKSDTLSTQWKLTLGENQWDWNITGKNINDIIPILVNHVTTTLSQKFAIVTTNTIQKSMTLKISSVRNQNDFSQLIRYLNQLAPVASVSIVNINGRDVLLNIGLRSTQESFLQTLQQDHKLSIMQQDNKLSPITLQWNPSS